MLKMKQQKQDVRDLVLSALLIALVTVSTMSIQVPVPMTSGYIHLGDSMIFLVAIFFGRKKGLITAGVGSMLADIFSGYAHWAPFTLIIKACMGYVAGSIAFRKEEGGAFFSIRLFTALIAGSLVMVGGYFVGGSILKSSMIVALQSVPENMIQAGLGAGIFLVVGKAFDKLSLQRYFEKRA